MMQKWMLLFLMIFGLGLVGCDQQTAATNTNESVVTEQKPAPDGGDSMAEPVDHLQIVDAEGIKSIVAETAAQDKVLVIDFWATWCVPCVQMFPGIHEGLVARGDKVRAVSVTLDDPSREAAAIKFLAKHDALHDAYIIKNDSDAQQELVEKIGKKWDSLVVPAILVYDAKGNLVGEFLEGGMTDAILEQVDDLLASGQEPQS